MAVSPITPVTLEGQPEELSSFLRAGVMYVLWSSPLNDTGLRRLRWKPHTSGDFTEVVPNTAFAFHEATTLYHPATDELVVIWDDSQAISQQQNGKLFYARFNVLTGALVAGPIELFQGSSPRLSYSIRAAPEGAWSSGPNMVNARLAPALSVLGNGDIIVTGGDDSPTPGPVFNTDKVERINFAGTTTTALTAMNYRRSYHSQVTLVDDSVFVIGGNQGGPVPHKAEFRHPVTGLWTLTPSVPTSGEAMLYNVACTALPDGRVAVFGGDGDPNGGSLVTKALHHVFNPATNTWVDMGTPALTPASAVLLTLPDGRVLRVGGYTRSAPFAARVYTSTAEIWNPATSSWSSVTGTGLAAAQQASIRLNDGTFLVFGGYAGTPGAGPLSTFLYTPDTANGSWKTVGNLPVPLLAGGQGATNMAAVVMDDGGVIAIGTNDPSNVPLSKVVAYYDPVLQTWSKWVDLPALYGEAIIARLNGNRVIHLGGDEDDLYVFSSTTRVVTGPPERVMLLYYLTVKSGGVYGRPSVDGGVTWQSGEPIVTNQVLGSTKLEVVPYDASHVSIAQLGRDPKGLAEIGSFTRTRPLSSIVKHPTVANTFFVGEPSKFDNVTLIDNLRGGLVLSTDNTKLYQLVGLRQGVDDGRGHLIKTTVTGTDFGSFVWPGFPPGANGDDVVGFTLAPALDVPNVDLPGTSYAVALDVSSTHGYVAEYADNSGTAGQFVVVDLAAGTTGTVFSGVTGVRAVGVANFLTPPLIFVGSTESGAERLRVYEQNGLTPSLVLNTKLPARANAITVIPHPTLPTGARVLVSMVDRFNIYDYTSGAAPVTLLDSYRFSGGGKFFRSKVATNGNIVVAAGDAGVLVLSPTGKVLAQIRLSSKVVDEWVASKVYALNQLVRPRDRHQFARSRYFFKVTNVGAGAATSGTSEPDWTNAPPLTVVYDPISPPTAGNTNSLQWTPQAVLDSVAVDVALDETAKRIYAVGNVGGDLGTDGRVWILNAAGLI